MRKKGRRRKREGERWRCRRRRRKAARRERGGGREILCEMVRKREKKRERDTSRGAIEEISLPRFLSLSPQTWLPRGSTQFRRLTWTPNLFISTSAAGIDRGQRKKVGLDGAN